MSLLKKITKQSLHSLGYYSALYHFRQPESHRLLILMYHDLIHDTVMRKSRSEPDAPTEGEFTAHLKALKRRFRVLSLEDAAEELNTEGKLKEPTAAITFDDGLASNYEIGFPCLKEQGLSATIFLTTDWINQKMIFWWHKLGSLLENAEYVAIEPNTIEECVECIIPDDIKQMYVEADRYRLSLRLYLESHFRSRRSDYVLTSIGKLRERLPLAQEDEKDQIRPLSWDQIQEMTDYGIRFGAHTVTHRNISHLTVEEGVREILESRAEIESKVDTRVSGFAFPHGMDVENYKRFGSMLKKNDFSYAVSASCGNNDQLSDIYTLRRVTLPHTESPAELERSLVLSYLEDTPHDCM